MEISWYSNHQKAEFSRMLTSEPVYLSENIALVNSSFNFDLTRNGTLYTIPTEVSWIVCRDNSGIWKMLDCHMNLEYSLEMSEIQ